MEVTTTEHLVVCRDCHGAGRNGTIGGYALVCRACDGRGFGFVAVAYSDSARKHKVRTRVRFSDGSEEVRYWDDSVRVLREAVLLAEHERGEDHAGAWWEYREAGWE